ncbi:hypothetical protein PIB30_040642 [Stylosanthes scabra]|uniref:Uncharacterized protein n=1 Tax=Stylosanthes scabra TaxID=79078 RepID=A0ABU6WEU1_9FABA|nr:hypothetical protein [Stylosanthes scabra]
MQQSALLRIGSGMRCRPRWVCSGCWYAISIPANSCWMVWLLNPFQKEMVRAPCSVGAEALDEEQSPSITEDLHQFLQWGSWLRNLLH